MRAEERWDRDADIVVVGSGAAWLAAALNAHELGNRVLVLEKADHVGGTTAKSVGTYWIPNNALMRDRGLQDSRDDAIRYMARFAFPGPWVDARARAAVRIGCGGEREP